MNRSLVLFFPSIEGGGVEKNFYIISNFLSKKFKEIYLVTANTNLKKKFGKQIVVVCPKSNFWVNQNRKIKTLICLILLIKNFFNKKIIILSFQSNVISIIFSKIFNKKIIIRLNTSIKKYVKNNILKYFFRYIYSLADRIIVNSIFFKKEIHGIFKLNSTLIYNSHQKLKEKKEINFFKNFKGLKILNIGRLTDQKNQILLLKSLNILSIKNIKYRCCIIGSGKEKQKLEMYIKNNNLKNFIKLAGYKKNAEKFLYKIDLFVLSSNYEGLPNVLIEAQNNNIPIISSDCPTGPRELLLNGKLGDLFEVNDYKKLSELIIQFSKNKINLQNKAILSKKYFYRFDLKKNCKKYYKIILKHIFYER